MIYLAVAVALCALALAFAAHRLARPRTVHHRHHLAPGATTATVLTIAERLASPRLTLDPATIADLSRHAEQLVRLAALGVREIPRAEPLAGTPDPDAEMRGAVRLGFIQRGATDLMQRAASIGATLTREQAEARAAQLLDSVEAPL